MPRRVVLTGVGLVTPLGIGHAETWKAILAGQSGIGPITRFDSGAYPTRIAGEVKGFDPGCFMSARELKSSLSDPFLQFAVAAGCLAMQDAGLSTENLPGERTGCYVGSGMGGLHAIETTYRNLLAKGPRHGVSPFFVTQLIINLAAGHLSMRFGAKGPCYSQVSACSSGANAIGDAFRLIQYGTADVMMCGGSEAVITPLGIGGFCSMKAMSTRNDEPTKASRPFDADRDGFVMAEGAGIVVLEERSRALDRGARIYAEVLGYCSTSDAYHVTAPSPDGEGAQRCMRGALEDAGVAASEVDYINAHGTSTPLNDATETMAIKRVFGERAPHLAVSSTKSMTGHLMGAAGGVEAAFCALALSTGWLPPTINHTTPDAACDLDYVPNVARQSRPRIAISNSFGFGGTNTSLVFGRGNR